MAGDGHIKLQNQKVDKRPLVQKIHVQLYPYTNYYRIHRKKPFWKSGPDDVAMIVLRYRYIKKHITYQNMDKMCFIFLSAFTWRKDIFFIICFCVLHRYGNELLSPLFMRVGPSNTFDIICFLHLSTYQGTYYFLDGTGEWLTFGGYIWRLYWRRISNMYFYLSSFSCRVKLDPG